eukprot:3528276-Pyramimonas_sp.AAC.1
MYNVSEDDVATWHANWFRKFRAEVASEAKIIMATHEAGADLLEKKFPMCILDEAEQTSEPMAIMSLNHAVRCGARMALFGDERQLCPTVKSQQALQWGLGVSILAKYVAAIGGIPECSVTLEECYRIHPSLLAWPSL